jgi:hypothetical protein
MNPATLVFTTCLGLIVCGPLLAPPLRAADQKNTAKELLAAKDFWDTTGSHFEHKLDAAVAADVHRLADDPGADKATRLRAMKLVVDMNGNSRAAKEFTPQQAASAVGAAMKHLEAILAGRKGVFVPPWGFTHLTISRNASDAGGVWVLIESVEPQHSGGMNIRVDGKTWAVTKVDVWGQWKKTIADELI